MGIDIRWKIRLSMCRSHAGHAAEPNDHVCVRHKSSRTRLYHCTSVFTTARSSHVTKMHPSVQVDRYRDKTTRIYFSTPRIDFHAFYEKKITYVLIGGNQKSISSEFSFTRVILNSQNVLFNFVH